MLVAHADQVEPRGRSDKTGRIQFRLFEPEFDGIECLLPKCATHDCAGNKPDHFIKKTRGSEFELDQIASGGDAKRTDCSRRVLIELATLRREIAKIMSANEQFCGALQQGSIEWRYDMPGAPEFKWGHDRTVKDAIAIDFSFSRKTSMEIRRDEPSAKNSNRGRQSCIERANPTLDRESSRLEIHVRTLAERMHTRIRSPRSDDADLRAANLFKRNFELVLDRVGVPLALPASKIAPVVADDEFHSTPSHALSRSR